MNRLGEQLERRDELIGKAGMVEDAEDDDRAGGAVLAGTWQQRGEADVADGFQDDRIVLACGVPVLPEQEGSAERSLFIIGNDVHARTAGVYRSRKETGSWSNWGWCSSRS